MTPERFGELLRRPQLLDGQNATELEELIAAHPWCGPLRLLRYRKAVLDEAADLDLWRARTEPFLRNATLQTDERKLRNAHPVRAQAHFAFTPEPEALPPTLAPLEDAEAQTPATDDHPLDAVPSPQIGTDLASSHEDFHYTAPPFDLAAHLFSVAAAVHTVDWYLLRNGLIMQYARPTPAPIEHLDSYKAWKHRRTRTTWNELLMLGIDPPHEKSKRKSGAKPKTVDTVTPEVASETLADLLAAQGHSDKAIRMYEQLSLRYPEKLASFAARIEDLRTLQNEV